MLEPREGLDSLATGKLAGSLVAIGDNHIDYNTPRYALRQAYRDKQEKAKIIPKEGTSYRDALWAIEDRLDHCVGLPVRSVRTDPRSWVQRHRCPDEGGASCSDGSM